MSQQTLHPLLQIGKVTSLWDLWGCLEEYCWQSWPHMAEPLNFITVLKWPMFLHALVFLSFPYSFSQFLVPSRVSSVIIYYGQWTYFSSFYVFFNCYDSHTINSFLYSVKLVIFSICTSLCNQHHYPIPEYFLPPLPSNKPHTH